MWWLPSDVPSVTKSTIQACSNVYLGHLKGCIYYYHYIKFWTWCMGLMHQNISKLLANKT